MFSSYQVNVPQIDADIDREKAKTHGVAISDIFDTLQVYLGSLYANDFNRFGRTYQVNVQAEQQFRLEPEQIGQLKVRNNLGEMVPLASFIKVSDTSGPDRVMHYNGFITAELNGAPAAGYSSGQAQAAIEAAEGGTAQRHDLRVDRADLPADPRRQYRAVRLPALRAAGLPRAGRPVRAGACRWR